MEIKEFDRAKIFRFNETVEYSKGAVVSKTIIKKETGTVTLFAFDKGEALSEHTAPFDAMINVTEGEADIYINSEPFHLKAGDSIIMPANIPHAVKGVEKFKMVLTMIKSK